MILSNCKRCIVLLLVVIIYSTSWAAGVRRPAGRRRQMQRRQLQVIAAKKMGKGKGSSMNSYFGEGILDMQEDALEAAEKDDKSSNKSKGKGKGKDADDDDSDDFEADDSDKNPVSGDEAPTVISNAFDTPAPTFKATEAPTIESTPPPSPEPTPKPTKAPSTPTPTTSEPTPVVTAEVTVLPSLETPQPTIDNSNTNQGETTVMPTSNPPITISPTTLAPTTTLANENPATPTTSTIPATESPGTDDSTATQGPTLNNTGEDDGPFGGRDYYHRHLVPFAVSVEGDEVSNDLGITSCLLTEMQKNMTNLFNLDITNFTIVHFNDVDGDGYNRYDLYFSGFGELLGLPVYSQEYFSEVQLSVLGDGVEFFQTCLDIRYADSGQSYTASALEHDNPNGLVEDGIQAEDSNDGTDEDSELRTSLIIGLTVAAVVVALCGIIFASRVLRGDDDGSSAAGRGKY